MNGPLNTPTRLVLCVISGVALGVAFPKFDINLLAWVAFVPLLQAIEGESMGRVFGYAFFQGLVCYVVSLYWIEFTLHHFAGVNPILAAGPLVLLAAIMALFAGLAIWAAQFATVRLGLPIFVTLPIAWPAVEWLRSFFPIGFPWNLLGYTAYRNLELIQFAEINRRLRRFGPDRVLQRSGFRRAVRAPFAPRSDLEPRHADGPDAGGACLRGDPNKHAGIAGAGRATPGRDGPGQHPAEHQVGPGVSRYQLQRLR